MQQLTLPASNQTLFSESLAFLRSGHPGVQCGGSLELPSNQLLKTPNYFGDESMEEMQTRDLENNTKVSGAMGNELNCFEYTKKSGFAGSEMMLQRRSEESCGVLKQMDTNCGSNEINSKGDFPRGSNLNDLFEKNLHHKDQSLPDQMQVRFSARHVPYDQERRVEGVSKEKINSQPQTKTGSRNRTSIMTNGMLRDGHAGGLWIPTDISKVKYKESKRLASTDFWKLKSGNEGGSRRNMGHQGRHVNVVKRFGPIPSVSGELESRVMGGMNMDGKVKNNQTSAIQNKGREGESQRSRGNSHLRIGSFGRGGSWQILNPSENGRIQNSFQDFSRKNGYETGTLLSILDKPNGEKERMNLEFLEYRPHSVDPSQKQSQHSSHSDFHDVYQGSVQATKPEFLTFPNRPYINPQKLITNSFSSKNLTNPNFAEITPETLLSQNLRIDLCPTRIICEDKSENHFESIGFKRPRENIASKNYIQENPLERNFVSKRRGYRDSGVLEIISESTALKYESKASIRGEHLLGQRQSKTIRVGSCQNQQSSLAQKTKMQNMQNELLALIGNPENYYVNALTKSVYLKLDQLGDDVDSKIPRPFQNSEIDFGLLEKAHIKARKVGVKKAGSGLMSITNFMKNGMMNLRFMKNVPEEEEEEEQNTSTSKQISENLENILTEIIK